MLQDRYMIKKSKVSVIIWVLVNFSAGIWVSVKRLCDGTCVRSL